MKKLTFPILVCIFAMSCRVEPTKETTVLDSLRKVYADKEVHITLHNTESGTKLLGSQYGYTDQDRDDLVFELFENRKYKVAFEEGMTHVETIDDRANTKPESDMVLIEELEGAKNRGYVNYKYIKEFSVVQNFEGK